MGSNREKSNIAIAILETKGNKIFRILMVAIIFSPTVYIQLESQNFLDPGLVKP